MDSPTKTSLERLTENLREPEAAGICPYCQWPFHHTTHVESEPCSLIEALLKTLNDPNNVAQGAIMTGIERITAERLRQVEVEGWTLEHDIGHGSETLSVAAICYLRHHYQRSAPIAWPWAPEWWKPCDQVRAMEKAGALIAAALDVEIALRGLNQASHADERAAEYGT